MSFSTSSVPWKSIDGVSDQFPAGLRVLVVDDDTTCLRVLEKMLKKCLYEVTKCTRAEVALNLLRSNKNGFDVVLSDVHMPDMDGFKLLEHVGLEMDLPVIMMSADDSQHVVMKGVTHGACDYLIKPVRMEALKNVWQHVIRKKKRTERKEKELEQQSGSVEEGDRQQPKPEDTIDYSSSANEGEGGSNNSSWRNCRKRKEDDDEGDDTSTLKKPRVVWSVELHQQFVTAVNQLGIDKAVPKKILELMNVPGLTRENVASHLQKYRLYLKRLSGQPHNGLGNAFICPTDPLFGPLNGLDFHALASSQLPPQSLPAIHSASLNRASTHRLLDQRNIFTFDQNPMNNTHGRPASLLPSRHLAAALHQQQQPVQPFTRTQIPNQPVFSQARPTSVPRLNEVNNPHNQPYLTPNLVDFSRGTRAELPVNVNKTSANINSSCSFPLVGNAGISSSSYSMFDNVNGRRANEWALPGFDGPQQAGRVNVGPSVVVQPGSLSEVSTVVNRAAEVPSSSQYNSNVGLHITSMAAEDSFQFQNSPFSDEFGQEDLMSALLRQPQPGSTTADESDFCFEGYSLDDLPV